MENGVAGGGAGFAELTPQAWEQIEQYVAMRDRAGLAEAWGGVLVRSQAELDAALADRDVRFIAVQPEWWVLEVLTAPLGGAPIVAMGDVHVMAGVVYARGDVAVLAAESAQVHAEGRAQVVAHGGARVSAYGQAQVAAHGCAGVHAHDEARVTADGSALIHARGKAQVTARGTTRVHAHEEAAVDAAGSAEIFAHGRVRVAAQGRATVTAAGQAQVGAIGSGRVKACEQAVVWAGDSVWIAATGGATVSGEGDAVRIWATAGVAVHADPGVVLRVAADDLIDSEWGVLDSLWQTHLSGLSSAEKDDADL
ncbi:hypothetical protein AB0N09_34605 [Streptomyces erythrochromogenes]|uniref:hypothetical protein n=1 Tax=Streptomyces erythrochromogenes TaxID=285574 RepID=UPI003448ADEF